jgi:hypothetical protein
MVFAFSLATNIGIHTEPHMEFVRTFLRGMNGILSAGIFMMHERRGVKSAARGALQHRILVLALGATISHGASATLIDAIDLNSIVSTGGAGAIFTISSPNKVLATPITGIFEATLQLSGDLTDTGQDGISLSPTDGLGIVRALLNGSMSVVFDLGSAVNAAGPFGPFSTSLVLNAADFGGSITSFQMVQKYQLTGFDSASVVSRYELATTGRVPSPGTAALFALGLICAALTRRRGSAFLY